jgi:hypothetical protein
MCEQNTPDQGAWRDWQDGFLAMLPQIRSCLQHAFRRLNPDLRAEAVQEGVVNAMAAYRRLWERGKAELGYPSVLAKFAASHIRAGRLTATRLNVRDVMSPYCQKRKAVKVERLDRYDRQEQCWQEILVEGRGAGPAEIAAARIDFASFLRSLSRREQEIVLTLIRGEPAGMIAKAFRISPGRISQIRAQLSEKWRALHGEAPRSSSSLVAA